jgi:hypothetical protein
VRLSSGRGLFFCILRSGPLQGRGQRRNLLKAGDTTRKKGRRPSRPHHAASDTARAKRSAGLNPKGNQETQATAYSPNRTRRDRTEGTSPQTQSGNPENRAALGGPKRGTTPPSSTHKAGGTEKPKGKARPAATSTTRQPRTAKDRPAEQQGDLRDPQHHTTQPNRRRAM